MEKEIKMSKKTKLIKVTLHVEDRRFSIEGDTLSVQNVPNGLVQVTAQDDDSRTETTFDPRYVIMTKTFGKIH